MSFVSNLLWSSQPDSRRSDVGRRFLSQLTETHPSKRPEDFALWTATPG
jgi:hypothetical protein